jgi:aquaporin Z
MPVSHARILTAELIGTTLLMLGGPGSAILAGQEIGFWGIALAFGFSLLVAAYAIGPITGCHINPAVTLGMVLMKKTPVSQFPTYVVAQFLGAALGGGIIFVIAQGKPGFDASTSGFATNGWGSRSPEGFNFGAMMVVELVFTALLVFVVLAVSSRRLTTVIGGVVAGLTLTLIHLVTIPVDNTSVNPARSFGAVLWSGNGKAWEQFWAFIVFPLLGAFLGVLVWLVTDESRLEDSMLNVGGMRSARDAMADVGKRVSDVTASAGDKLDDRFREQPDDRTEGLVDPPPGGRRVDSQPGDGTEGLVDPPPGRVDGQPGDRLE